MRRTLLVVMALAMALAVLVPPAGAHQAPWSSEALLPGVTQLRSERPHPVVVDAVRVEPGGPVMLRPVLADGVAPVSEICRQAGGVVCVNGDFFTRRRPYGGIVRDGLVLRSPHPHHDQLSLVDGAPTSEPLHWVGRLAGSVGSEAPTHELELRNLNRGPVPGEAVLYTSAWGRATPSHPGQLEVVLATGGDLAPGVVAAAPVAIRPGGGPIPPDGVVISANGRAAEVLDDLWRQWHAGAAGPRRLVVDTALSFPAQLSIGGHPVLLRGGQRASLDHADSMVTGRHPRTLIGWRADGSLLLVAVDGRQRGYSEGITLHEATDLLLELGAVEAMNLDGGGSTTLVRRCPEPGFCVQNRPSDGHERAVPMALALLPTEPIDPSRSPLLAASASPPQAPPAALAVAPEAPPPPAPEPTPTPPPLPDTTPVPAVAVGVPLAVETIEVAAPPALAGDDPPPLFASAPAATPRQERDDATPQGFAAPAAAGLAVLLVAWLLLLRSAARSSSPGVGGRAPADLAGHVNAFSVTLSQSGPRADPPGGAA